LDNVNLTGIGLLSAFHLMHYVGSGGIEVRALPQKEKEKIGDLQKGITLADNLKLRLSSRKDVNDLSFFPNTVNSAIPYCLNRFVIECSLDVTGDSEIQRSASKEIISLINNSITALRLLKKGYIDSNCILSITNKETGRQSGLRAERSIPNTAFMEPYYLRTDELMLLRDLIERISGIDFETRKRLKVALRRFENSYYDIEDEDKLIDYMIAFEALFTVGKRGSKGDKIAAACATLLGESEEGRQQIRDTLKFAYQIRNSIVHGEDFEKKLGEDFFLEDLVAEVEENLRKSLKKFM